MGFIHGAMREYGDVVWLRLGNLRTYLVSHPEHIEYVLRSHADNFRKDRLTRWLVPLLGEGLLTSEGTFWRRHAGLPSRHSSTAQIERYAAVMVENTERMLESCAPGDVRDPHEDLMRLTLGIVARTLFDAELSGDAETVGQSLEVVMNHFMSPLRWFRFLDYLPLPSSRRYWARSLGSTRSSTGSSGPIGLTAAIAATSCRACCRHAMRTTAA